MLLLFQALHHLPNLCSGSLVVGSVLSYFFFNFLKQWVSQTLWFNRHEFYQKPEEVVVTIFAKGIPKQNVNVEFGDQIVSILPQDDALLSSDECVLIWDIYLVFFLQLSVVIDVAGEEAYHFQPRLFGKVYIYLKNWIVWFCIHCLTKSFFMDVI